LPLELRGERVVLRPLRPEELDVVAASLDEEAVASGAVERLRSRIRNSGRFLDGHLDLGVEADGELVGDISARRPPAALPGGVFELGIALLESRRGRGYATDAIRLLTQHLFDELGAGRVQASTDVENAAMRRVLRKLGFVEEGVMRGFMPTGGGRADYVLYGVTKTEWRAGLTAGRAGTGGGCGSAAASTSSCSGSPRRSSCSSSPGVTSSSCRCC
jgi:RimJ/RimL family protein N-acetyltransferase